MHTPTPEVLFLLLRSLNIPATMAQTRETTLPERVMIGQWACNKFVEANR